jgi:hypothetical protein
LKIEDLWMSLRSAIFMKNLFESIRRSPPEAD